MHKILLVAVNACYNHTNIAVRSLALFSGKPDTVGFGEWTINQPAGEILRGIAGHSPDVVLFSTYIWNIEIVEKLVQDIKKILPDCVCGAGGPEVSYYAEEYLKQLSALDFVIAGEGEQTIKEIAELYDGKTPGEFLEKVSGIKGLFLKVRAMKDVRGEPEVIYTGNRELICDLNSLPFPYPEITDPDNKIYYYESCRGCPFSCAYCMSSLDKKVRFRDLDQVYADLQRFLDANVRLVKFVDRTFNLNPERYVSIWKYILKHHNGKTMFHFEIEAEYLDKEALEFLQSVPAGIMQFEIGVQSSNKRTLEAVGRSPNVEKLAENIRRIPKTIHSHLDLIAGLPFENLEIFGHSFDFVMDLRPDALQLGFLKVLHGTTMESYCKANGWKWMENPPYETLCTPYMSYDDFMFLKDLETVVDAYWNSGKFTVCMEYAFRKTGSWNFFVKMTEIARNAGAFEAPRKESYWSELLADVCRKNMPAEIDSDVFYELLRFDFIKAEKRGRFPEWYIHHYDKDLHKTALLENGGISNARLDYGFSDVDSFSVNPFEAEPETAHGTFKVLFIYERKEKFALSTLNNSTRQILL